jgi:hypothetical protein
MNKVTIYIKQKKFLYALLRNSTYIPSDRDVEDIPTIIIKNILSKSGIRYIKTYEDDDSNIIITDDISIATIVKDKDVIFIPPIDFNVIDGYVMELQRMSNPFTIQKYNTLDYLKINHPNLKLISPSLIDHPNLIFDLSLVLNYNLYDDKWGAIHYNAKNLFSTIKYKPYRIDYSIREIRKLNRIKLFLELIDSNLSDNIKLTIHDLFLHDKDMYELSKTYFNENGYRDYFDRLISLDDTHYSKDELWGKHYGYQDWPIGKLINHTLKSDIALYNESSPEENEYSSMDYLITEKTIDLLSIGKPFIYNSKIVKEFNLRYGFIDYNKSVFNVIGKDIVSIIKTISNMHIQEYEVLIETLNKLARKNLKKLEEYRDKNTFLQSLISN